MRNNASTQITEERIQKVQQRQFKNQYVQQSVRKWAEWFWHCETMQQSS